MRAPIAALLVLSGCRSLLGFDEPVLLAGDARRDSGGDDDAREPDAPADAFDTPDTVLDSSLCFGTRLVVCLQSAPTGSMVINTNRSIDTTNDPLCASDHPQYCLVVANTLVVEANGKLTVSGNRPLVMLATGSIQINGTIDVASHRGQVPGAGANAMGCASLGPAGTGGGGAGGTFVTPGGKGGTATANAGAGGTPAPIVPPAFHGGCKAGNGGGPSAGVGGAGGGAVYIISGSSLVIGGTINASGAGGFGAASNQGGAGGGGSGGMIGLESTGTTISGDVFANGGGGGEGASSTTAGRAGEDPITPNVAASGGSGGSAAGGDGGNGAAGNTSAQLGSNATVSAGGGGGGGGVIWIDGPRTVNGGAVSPDPT